MFDPTSRYYGLPTLEMTDHRGRTVQIVTVPDAPRQQIRGEHLRRQGQRLDHLAAFYLQDPHGYWRIAEVADVMHPEALTEATSVPIPSDR
jgi:hypothetical protein